MYERKRSVLKLWEEFDRYNVNAVLPRNMTSLNENKGGDVDILIRPEELKSAIDAISSFAEKHKWRTVFSEEIENHYQIILIREARNQLDTLHIDLQKALGRKGFYYGPTGPLIDRAETKDGISVLVSSGCAFAMALHVLLDKGYVKEQYRKEMLNDLGHDFEEISKQYFLGVESALIKEWILQGSEESKVTHLRHILRRKLISLYPLNSVKPFMVRMRRRIRIIGPRRGVLIAFLGPDGAGKTTIIENVTSMMPTGPYPIELIYMGKKKTFLPTSHLIRWFYSRPVSANKSEGNKVGNLKSVRLGKEKIIDILGLINWIIEQWTRPWIPKSAKLQQDGIVLTDRYSFDLANRAANSIVFYPKFLKLLRYIFPVPDRTYLLWESPEVLYERKPENSIQKSEELLKNLRMIVRSVPNHKELRTNTTIDEASLCIAKDIIEIMEMKNGH